MPPITAAMKPKIVYMRPVSNWNDVIGPMTTPPAAPMAAASTKLNTCIRATPMPISAAASGFSAQARKARPTRLPARVSASAMVSTAVSPTSQSPCGASNKPPATIGRSPEKAGRVYD